MSQDEQMMLAFACVLGFAMIFIMLTVAVGILGKIRRELRTIRYLLSQSQRKD